MNQSSIDEQFKIPVVRSLTKLVAISHDKIAKIVSLIHPHWDTGLSGYRKFIRSMKETFEVMPGYLFIVTGCCTFKGAYILGTIFKHIKQDDNIESVDLNFYDNHSCYCLKIKVKDI